MAEGGGLLIPFEPPSAQPRINHLAENKPLSRIFGSFGFDWISLGAKFGTLNGTLNTLPTQALFNYYNRTIWNDRLPRVKVRRRLKKGIRALLPKDQLGGCALRGLPYIWIHPILTGRALKRVLIHEMCHLASGWRGRGHNHQFFKEVIQCPEFVIQYECGKRQTVQLVKQVFGIKKPAF